MKPFTDAQLISGFEALCAVSLLVQAFEFWRLRSAHGPEGVWQWSIQRQDLVFAPRVVRAFFDTLFAPHFHAVHLVVRMLLATSLFWGSSLFSSTLLFLSTICVLVRWRGSFNGGSDFMTLVVLSGLLLTHLLAVWMPLEVSWRGGLWYVTIQSLTSYFISGAIKLQHRPWRTGSALRLFLDTAIFGPLATRSVWHRAGLAAWASWSFILWECSAPLALLSTASALIFCALAAVFHGLVFWYFGLNRFFWAWAATFPAIIFCAADLQRISPVSTLS